MKKMIYAILMVTMLLLCTACSGPSHMVKMENEKLDIRTVKPEKDMAALVVTRTTSLGLLIEFDTYLDKKMIGVTKGKSYFVKRDIPPGTHYLIASAESFESAKINFEPNRVYYIHQTPRPGWIRARISMYTQDPNTTVSDMGDSCTYYEYDVKDPGEDLTEEEYKKAIKEYEEDVAGGEHKEYATYRGVEVK